MSDTSIEVHAKAVNLARRLTSQNENDILGFVGYEDTGDPVTYTRDMCSEIAKHVLHTKNLPQECMKFTDIVKQVNASDTDVTHPTSWMI